MRSFRGQATIREIFDRRKEHGMEWRWRRRRIRMEEEDEAGCCARHGTLASGLESWAPRARRCIASFTSQPLFYPFFFHLSSPYFFLSLSLFLSLSPSFLSSARRSWKRRRRDYSVAKWQPSRLVSSPPLFSTLRRIPHRCFSVISSDFAKV